MGKRTPIYHRAAWLRRPSPGTVLAIVALVAGLGGAAYAAKKIGTKQLVKKERSQGYFTRQAANLALPAGADTTVATLTLPGKGTFEVSATTALGGASAGLNSFRCQLRDDGAVIAAGDGHTEGPIFAEAISLTAFANGGSVTLTCNPSLNAVARDRAIAATRVAKLQTQ